eukprot:COSAG05_NODE_20531_length_278_cov_1.346369_1_plen_78_part_01
MTTIMHHPRPAPPVSPHTIDLAAYFYGVSLRMYAHTLGIPIYSMSMDFWVVCWVARGGARQLAAAGSGSGAAERGRGA